MSGLEHSLPWARSGRPEADGRAGLSSHDENAHFPAAVVEADVCGYRGALFMGHAPELFRNLAVEVPAGLDRLKPKGGVDMVGGRGEGVGGEGEVATGEVGLERFDDGGEHAAADAAALVLRWDMDGPEIEAGGVVQVHRDAADRNPCLAGNVVPVLGEVSIAGESGGTAERIAEGAEVEGVVRETAVAPVRELGHEVIVPAAEDEAVALDHGLGGSRHDAGHGGILAE